MANVQRTHNDKVTTDRREAEDTLRRDNRVKNDEQTIERRAKEDELLHDTRQRNDELTDTRRKEHDRNPLRTFLICLIIVLVAVGAYFLYIR